MTTTETYRFGRLTLSQSTLPTPAEVYEGINDRFAIRKEEYDEVRDETRIYKEKGRDPHLGDDNDDHSFCCFSYISDTPESILIRNDDDEEEEVNDRRLETSRILYFENGQFAFESRLDLLDLWIPQFIGEVTNTELNEDDWRFDSLPQEVMTSFFQDRPVISILKVEQPENKNTITGDSALDQTVADLAGRVESQRFSVGKQRGNNLKGASIISEAAENLDILEVSGKYENSYTTNLKITGSVSISWNESDWSDTAAIKQRAELIQSRLIPYLRQLND